MPGPVPGSGPLVPTFHGFVQNSMDGLILFEACLGGKLHHVPRRPHDRERDNLIKSGSIFVYEENASGIKRWTDGVAWSPSRILCNFLIYRELDKPFAPGEKKRAMKRKRSFQADGQPSSRPTSDGEEEVKSELPESPATSLQQRPRQASPAGQNSTDASETATPAAADNDREMERQLIGSLVDSYGFRPNGLVKKTMSVSIKGVSHHLVSYYSINDVKHRNLIRPMDDARLSQLTVRPELYLKQNFRTPVEETEHYVVNPSNMHARPGYGYGPLGPEGGAYGMRPGQPLAPPGYHMYGPPPVAPSYAGLPPSSALWQSTPQHSLSDSGYGRQDHTSSAAALSDGYSRQPSTMQSSVSEGYGRHPNSAQSIPPDSYGMASGYQSHASTYGASHHDMRLPSPPPPQSHHSGGHGPSDSDLGHQTSPDSYSSYRMVYGNRPNA